MLRGAWKRWPLIELLSNHMSHLRLERERDPVGPGWDKARVLRPSRLVLRSYELNGITNLAEGDIVG
jgi:hypothetical protein